MARMAGTMALGAGRPRRAADVLHLARSQWSTLGRDDEVTAIDALIAQATSRASLRT